MALCVDGERVRPRRYDSGVATPGGWVAFYCCVGLSMTITDVIATSDYQGLMRHNTIVTSLFTAWWTTSICLVIADMASWCVFRDWTTIAAKCSLSVRYRVAIIAWILVGVVLATGYAVV